MKLHLAWLLLAVLGAEACKVKIRGGSASVEGDFPCETVESCPPPDNPCLLSACWEGQCVYVPAPEGTLPEPDQVAGDCKELVCDGAGNPNAYTAHADLPPGDGNPCTEAVCNLDRPAQEPVIAGTACGDTRVCTGTGLCGVCLPNEARCAEAAVERCDERGEWAAPVACSVDQPRCNRAQCVGIVEVAVGEAHGCARFDDGSVACWGADGRGQLGQSPPTPAAWATGFGEVAFGPRHACGIRTDRSVWCWGAGDWGQLGHGSYTSSPTPVATGIRASAIAVGRDHTCALDKGEVKCWGRNDRGQLGYGTAPSERMPPSVVSPQSARSGPVQMVGDITGATALWVDASHSCIRLASGELRCWGLAPFPLPATPPDDDEDAEASARHTAREEASAATPQAIPGLSAVTVITAGDDHTCALAHDEVSCWGAGDRHRLGVDRADAFAPTPVEGPVDVTQLWAGDEHTCALSRDGIVRCWGDNRHGELGVGQAASAGPSPIATLGPAASLHVGGRFACALLRDGSMHCWGDGRLGQLGAPETTTASTPRPFHWH